ncbi:MAG TPA: hypothetical protein VFS43_03515 [Polyangiaceae bacterium]|nr:hypothetical protein [Polyangiaceae bacterium]
MRRTTLAPAAAALALASLFAPPLPAQDDAGLEWARAEVKRAPPPDDVESIYWPARGAPRVLRPCRAACRRSWHLAAGPLPADELAKRPIYRVTAVPAAAAPPAPAPTTAPVEERERLGLAPPPVGLDELVRAYPTAAPAQSPAGVAQGRGAVAVAEGALQAAGQAVVDRASSAALERVRDKIVEGLRCAGPAPAPAPARFGRTCAVVGALRLPDLAQHGHVLLDALLRDALAQALPEAPGEARAALEPLRRVLVPEIARLLEGRVGRGAEVVAQRLVEAAMADLRRTGVRERLAAAGGASRGRSAIALAALAHAYCARGASPPGGATTLAHCPVGDHVRRAAAEASVDDPAVLTRAHELARLLLDAMTLQSEGAGAWRERASQAAAAAFVAACLSLDASPELKGCPPAHEVGPAPSALERLALARFLTNAAIDGDPNALVVGAVAAADAAARGAADRPTRRALRLVGALLQYTGTYADRKLDGVAARERRARVLEDLSAEMSDRSERDGDAIWSLGGSLRLAGGARFGVDSDRTALYGPLSLPLGLGFQTVAEGGFGLHLEVSAFDLGQYVAFEEGGAVREPELADALAPSVTVGAAFGKSVPFVIGPTIGYSPQFAFSDGKRGAINFGLALGLYVPLLDLN